MSSWHQYAPLPSACQGQLHTPQPLTSHPSELSFQSWSETTQWQCSKFQGSTNFTKLYLSHFKILDARSVIRRKFCTEDLNVLGTTTKNSVTLVTWHKFGIKEWVMMSAMQCFYIRAKHNSNSQGSVIWSHLYLMRSGSTELRLAKWLSELEQR